MIPSYIGNANQWFYRMIDDIINNGMKTRPRDMDVYELLHQMIVIPNPRERVLAIFNRRANPFFQIAETVWILSGASDVEWITHFNSQLNNFVDKNDNPYHFHAPYGERIRKYGQSNKYLLYPHKNNKGEIVIDQIDCVAKELRNDKDSRRAIIIIGNPQLDNNPTLDRPCNIVLMFKLRNDKLDMTTINRSNDMLLGLTFTNIVQFTSIQEVIASIIGVEIGQYYHYSDSLHIYFDSKVYPRLNSNDSWNIYDEVSPTKMIQTNNLLQQIESLYKPFSYRINNSERYLESVKCSYWKSAGLMIQAWDKMHRNEDISSIINTILEIPAEDWRFASLEYFVRWAHNRLPNLDLHSLLHKEHYKNSPILERWIFHSLEENENISN